MKYPKTPHIHKDGKDVRIDYNGVRLEISPAQQLRFEGFELHQVRFKKLEKEEGEAPKEESFEMQKNRDQYQEHCSFLRNLNMGHGAVRKHVVKIITQYADWFGESEKARLDDLIERAFSSSASSAQEQGGACPMDMSRMQRKEDREYYREMLRSTTEWTAFCGAGWHRNR